MWREYTYFRKTIFLIFNRKTAQNPIALVRPGRGAKRTHQNGCREEAVIDLGIAIFVSLTPTSGTPTADYPPDAVVGLQPHPLHGKRLREVGRPHLPQIKNLAFEQVNDHSFNVD